MRVRVMEVRCYPTLHFEIKLKRTQGDSLTELLARPVNFLVGGDPGDLSASGAQEPIARNMSIRTGTVHEPADTLPYFTVFHPVRRAKCTSLGMEMKLHLSGSRPTPEGC